MIIKSTHIQGKPPLFPFNHRYPEKHLPQLQKDFMTDSIDLSLLSLSTANKDDESCTTMKYFQHHNLNNYLPLKMKQLKHWFKLPMSEDLFYMVS